LLLSLVHSQALQNELAIAKEQLREAEAEIVDKEEKAKLYIRHAVRETAAKVEQKYQVSKLTLVIDKHLGWELQSDTNH